MPLFNVPLPEHAALRPPLKLNVMLMTDVTGRGGAEKALVDLALHLDRRRYNVSVCASRWAGNYQPILDAAGVRTVVLGRRTRLDSYKLAGLVALMRHERVHILHTHLFGSNTWGRILGRLAGVPVIIAHEHWSSKDPREVWVDRLLYPLSDCILVPSQASKCMVTSVEHIPARYLRVVYNGVDSRQFAPSGDRAATRCALGVAPEAFLVGTVGRLSPEKGGVDLLIRAVARLRRANGRAQLLVVGDGPLRAGLERLAAELDAPVLFTGTRSDVARLLGAMDAFALPSLHEALPIAVLEAMWMGLPVVATRVGGVPEVVRHELDGLLVPPGDDEALYRALLRLEGNSGLAHMLASAAQAHVRAHFTIELMIKRVERIYEQFAMRKMKAITHGNSSLP